MNWNTNVITTAVTGTAQAVTTVLPAKAKTLTWAFATGACGAENWGGMTSASIASANVQSFVSAGKSYILSTGGAGGAFTCTTDSGFSTFINTYNSANLLGVDFDIEAGQSQTDINNLVQRVIAAQKTYPNLRFSFTVATFGGSANPSLGGDGTMVMNAISTYGLKNYIINLMTMDFGTANANDCVMSGSACNMGASSTQAAVDLHTQYGVAYNEIEITPMIGGNDSAGETFTPSDVATVTTFVKQNALAGTHFWSFDRDRDCAAGSATTTCNTYGSAGTLGYTNAFISGLGL